MTTVSPQWANVMGYGLYFYYGERHRRPHVDVRRGATRATLDIVTGEVLAGELPPRILRAVRSLLHKYRDEALQAFETALDHRPPGRLEVQED